MYNPIIITTLCDKYEIAERIQNRLLEKRLIAGCQISERKSKYWWNDNNVFVFSIAGILSNIISIISTFIAMRNQLKINCEVNK